MRLEAISIGNELLTGDVLDRNATYLGQVAQRFGVCVSARQTIPDEEQAMVEAFQLAGSRADLVVVSGGLGPTSDDLTAQAAALFSGQPLRRDEVVLTRIKERFARSGRTFTENNARQADIPNNGIALNNPVGTAPGICLEYQGTVFLFFPGVHMEYVRFVDEEVAGRLRDHVGAPVRWKTLRTFGWTESAVAQALETMELGDEEWLQYRASFPEILVTIVVRGEDVDQAEERVAERCTEIRSILGPIVYGEGDQTLSAVIGQVLERLNYQIAVAESCTGGLIGHMITSTPGASAYFKEGVIAYSNQTKINRLDVSEETLAEYGAVSEETVREMVEGLCGRSGADVGIAVSGVAGPTGGTEQKPVGTVCWAIRVPGQPIKTRKIVFPGSRTRVTTLAAWSALESVRRACDSEAVGRG